MVLWQIVFVCYAERFEFGNGFRWVVNPKSDNHWLAVSKNY